MTPAEILELARELASLAHPVTPVAVCALAMIVLWATLIVKIDLRL